MASAEAWTKRANDTGDFKTFETDYDWTYSTKYAGSVSISGGEEVVWEGTEVPIDYDHLKIRDLPILWFQEVSVFPPLFTVD